MCLNEAFEVFYLHPFCQEKNNTLRGIRSWLGNAKFKWICAPRNRENSGIEEGAAPHPHAK